MPGAAFGGELDVHRALLGVLEADPAHLAALEQHAAALVEGELGVDHVLMVLEHPRDAALASRLLVALGEQDDVAIELHPRALEEDQGHRAGRDHTLVVDHSSSIVVAVALRYAERLRRPALLLHRHHVDVPEQERWASAPLAR